MNPLLLIGGGGLVAYLLLRRKDADAATLASVAPPNAAMLPATRQPPTLQVPPAATPTPIAIVVQATNPSAPKAPPNTKPSQVATSAPSFNGEVAASRQPATIIQLNGRWGWPVPRWQGRAPVISDGFGSPRAGMTHMGVDLMFARISSDPFPKGSNGSKHFVMPDAWMAVASGDGVLWSAGHTPRGFAIVLDHGNVATFYQHLETLMVPETKPPAKGTPRERLIQIKAGQPLGVIGGDPLDPSHLKHLHFELWPGGPASAIDPQPLMKTWQVFTPNDIAPFLPALTRNAVKKRYDLVPVRAHERRWPGAALNPPR